MTTTEISPVIETGTFVPGHPNTRLDYMYRDADNYKQNTHVVMAGALTIEQAVAIVDGLGEDDGFVPSGVGLPDLQEQMVTDWDEQSDHPYHEITGISLTVATPTVEMTAAEFIVLFAAADWSAEGARVIGEHASADD
jgi:hypothetical protein